MTTPNRKLKFLQEIQQHVSQREVHTAQKKLLRHQKHFKFKEGDEESALYYTIIFQMGSYKLFQKLILPSLDFKILFNESTNPELNLKRIILAHVLASQGAYKTSLFLLNKIQNPTEGILVTQCLHSAYMHNWEIEKCVNYLEAYRTHLERENGNIMHYFCARTLLDILGNNLEDARASSNALYPLMDKSNGLLHKDFARFVKFAVATMEGALDIEGFEQANFMGQNIIGERIKLTIKIVQLRHLLILGDADKILDFIDGIYLLMKAEDFRSSFFDLFIQREFPIENYKDSKKLNFKLKLHLLARGADKTTCIEWTKNDMLALDYFSIGPNGSQLDLVAGVMTTSDGVFLLTELQRNCLHCLVVSGDLGVSWLRLSEVMYDEAYCLDTSFENIRKIVANLRKMKINISNKSGCYYFHNNFDSVIFTNEIRQGDQLLFIRRYLGDSPFFADDVSKILGLKKSRTSEYLRKWVEEKRITIVPASGNQKKYQIIKNCPI